MSLNTFMAVLVGFGLFIAAIALSTDNYTVFMSGAAIILVLGGTLASTFISYEYTYVLDSLRGIFGAFKIDRRGR
ncbi:MAG: flagellar motor protein MotA, partial [Alphaproteobacteria bacterium]|nr:flagellar motor protein MotA [Alphaproteobacteria bacterium]